MVGPDPKETYYAFARKLADWKFKLGSNLTVGIKRTDHSLFEPDRLYYLTASRRAKSLDIQCFEDPDRKKEKARASIELHCGFLSAPTITLECEREAAE